MRRALLGVGAAALATIVFAGPASAGCPADGSVPGGGPSTVMVGTGGTSQTTFYIDDRDFADADEDGRSDGLWVYQEDNGRAGLQRGGDQFLVAGVPGQSPKIDPIALPNGGTLFPNGFGGESWSSTLGFHDDCKQYGGTGQPTRPDKIWV